ncbi:MAG: tetratricopeptide repeat protein [Gemmatimonadota bacterium]
MTKPAPADVQRWSLEVARDPGAPTFVNLADAYRRQGNLDGALRVCLRGLERRPDHAGAHALLARLHLERGEREKAFDEWGVVLRLDPAHFEANRGMGFVRLERGDLLGATAYLERAAARRPADALTREALELVARKTAQAAPSGPLLGHQAAASEASRPPAPAPPPGPVADTRSTPTPTPAPAGQGDSPASAAPSARDPGRLFEELAGNGPFRGALLVDGAGFVIGGRLGTPAVESDAAGAALRGAAGEAERTAELLGLGAWRGVHMQTDDAAAHLGPVGKRHAVLITADGVAPTGWVLHTAGAASEIARAFLGEDRG